MGDLDPCPACSAAGLENFSALAVCREMKRDGKGLIEGDMHICTTAALWVLLKEEKLQNVLF